MSNNPQQGNDKNRQDKQNPASHHSNERERTQENPREEKARSNKENDPRKKND